MIELRVTGATLEEIRDALNELYIKKEANPAASVSTPPLDVPPAPTADPVSNPAASVSAPPITAAPTAAPTFTLAQVAKAGADFVAAHPEKMGELTAKLAAYGVQSVAQLGESQLGAFATELRAMGGAI